MGFQLRSRSTIVAGMLADLRAMGAPLTDATVGSVNRSILESVGTEVAALEQAVYDAAVETLDVGTFKNFQFAQLPATSALGKVIFTFQATTVQLTIPQGTRVAVPGAPGRTYAVMSDTIIPPSAVTALVPVAATTSGEDGNTAANTVTTIVDAVPMTNATVTNPAPFLNGLPAETLAQRFNRFQNFVAGLSQATIFALQSAATGVAIYNPDGTVLETVQSATVVENFATTPPGALTMVAVYIDNGAGFASEQLVNLVSQHINGYVDGLGHKQAGTAAAGVTCTVLPVVPQPVTVNVNITIGRGYDAGALANGAVSAIATYIAGLMLGDTFVVQAANEAIMDIPGVTDVQNVTPVSNVVPQAGRRITAGPITVQCGVIIAHG